MEPLPLIPKSNLEENHEVFYIFREVFQEVLGIHTFARNVVESAKKYCIGADGHLKDNVTVVNGVIYLISNLKLINHYLLT